VWLRLHSITHKLPKATYYQRIEKFHSPEEPEWLKIGIFFGFEDLFQRNFHMPPTY
jgi:hypothetical protein